MSSSLRLISQPLFTWYRGKLSSWPLAIELELDGNTVVAQYWVSWLLCDYAQCSILFYKLPDGQVIKFQPKGVSDD